MEKKADIAVDSLADIPEYINNKCLKVIEQTITGADSIFSLASGETAINASVGCPGVGFEMMPESKIGIFKCVMKKDKSSSLEEKGPFLTCNME